VRKAERAHRAASPPVGTASCGRLCPPYDPDTIHRPYFLIGAGYAAVRSAILRSSRGAERRQTRGFARPPERLAKPPETLARRLLPPCDRRKAPPGAPLAAFSVPLGPRFRSATGHDGPYPERWPPLLHRPHVQPCSWAAGRNAGGRLAGGLPSPAYEAGSRAPHRRDGFPRFVRRDNKAASPAPSLTAAPSSARLR